MPALTQAARSRWAWAVRAMSDKKLSASDYQVLLAISSSANKENKANLSFSRIAQLTGISRKNIPRVISRLKAEGYIDQSLKKTETGANDNSEFEIFAGPQEEESAQATTTLSESKTQIASQMIEIWREEVRGVLPVPMGVLQDRAATCYARYRDIFGRDLEQFRAYIGNEIMTRPFLRGEGERGWKASFDWALKPQNIQKIREGMYRDHQKKRDGTYNVPELGPGGTGTFYTPPLGPGGT